MWVLKLKKKQNKTIQVQDLAENKRKEWKDNDNND
jgi:hypothetical protein